MVRVEEFIRQDILTLKDHGEEQKLKLKEVNKKLNHCGTKRTNVSACRTSLNDKLL